MEIALALLFSGTRSAAMVDAIDMNTPCEKADSIRAINRTPMLPEADARLLPAIKTTIMAISSVLRDIPVVSEVSTGAPKVTPSAYSVTVNPAVVIDI
ncbi:hypothetical protein D3C75_918480 [compost metagenome]